MQSTKAEKLFDDGIAELKMGNVRSALGYFSAAAELDDSPLVKSYLGYCLAKEKGHFSHGVSLCREAILEDSANSDHYLNLGRIYLLSGNKKEALRIFRDGLLQEDNRGINEELKNLGRRKPPFLQFLPREHLMNRFLGILAGKCGFR
jgi:tetratricopeptide (TPR) repeat protein